jgi:hypothetical protein
MRVLLLSGVERGVTHSELSARSPMEVPASGLSDCVQDLFLRER